ncbi:hydrolase [Actinokineospora sp. NBRC 105648]|nr:hydrolase [Actinokineospora sp. NBRC 105648]
MSDGARIGWSVAGDTTRTPPVVLLHGGPGVPDYLGEVAAMVSDIAPTYRYFQRGTGPSEWRGPHTLARHVADLAELLETWGPPRAIFVGHSYGTDLAARFCLAHADKVAALLFLCGPFVGDWRAADRAERDRRTTPAQRERHRELGELPSRTEEQERELLTLSWFTDHADTARGWTWATRSAEERRPINWSMNRDLGRDNRADPLDDHLDELRSRLPAAVEIVGGVADPRPISALAALAERFGVPLTAVEDAGHEPWLEQPEAVRAIVRDFVRRAATTG